MNTKIITTLQKWTKQYPEPLINTIIKEFGKNTFLILIACLLSLRSKDVVTIHACRTLFKKVTRPQEFLEIPPKELEQIIFSTGFYRNKSKTIRYVSKKIIEEYNGQVPNTVNKLLAIKGIGRKTANLVVGLAFGTPAICVDTHVHRISNRLGLIKTKTPYQTEMALQKIIPKKYWIEWNRLLVIWGQNICTPRSPKCNICPLNKKGRGEILCPRIDA
jgi:endonuclease-3